MSLHRAQNLAMYLPDRPTRVDRDHPLRLSLRDQVISGVHPSEESAAFPLEAVFIPSIRAAGNITPSRTRHTRCNIGIHQDRQIRLQAGAEQFVKGQHCIATELPSTALVSL